MEGNQMKMREALLNIQEYAAGMDVDDGNVLAILDACQAALSAPPRNCDEGTPEEQMERFRAFCRQEKCGRYRCGWGCKATCIERCAIDWAQTPYEAEEGAGK